MEDKELLELAALAAGYEVIFKNGLDDDGYDDGIWKYTWIRIQGRLINWNPLTDDGDALRLAVKLGIEYRRITMPHNIGGQAYDGTIQAVFESYGDDPYAATRRAIVRAAAEIGKSMRNA